jgi:hypothetical protein
VPNLGGVEKSRPSKAQTALTLIQPLPLCQTPFQASGLYCKLQLRDGRLNVMRFAIRSVEGKREDVK